MSSSCVHLTAQSLPEIIVKVEGSQGGSSSLASQLRAGVKCGKCSKNSSIWMCIASGCDSKFACGRADSGHAEKHYEKYKHPVSINVKTAQVWCYLCDAEVLELNNQHDTANLQRLQKSVTAANAGDASAAVRGYDEAPTDTRKGLVGLNNLGNTCFLNAGLQCLSNSPAFTQFFVACPAFLENPTKRFHPIVQDFANLCQHMWSGTTQSALSPQRVVTDVHDINPTFRGYGQQDSHDFLRTILDKLHEELKKEVLKPAPPTETAAADDDGSSSEEVVDGQVRRKLNHLGVHRAREGQAVFTSPVSRAFQGLLLSTVQCSECKKESLTRDYFFDLSVEIPSKNTRKRVSSKVKASGSGSESGTKSGGIFSSMSSFFGGGGTSGKVTLEECLHAYCDTEELTGADRYYCENCKAKHDSLKTLMISDLPETLCIQIKRFRFDSIYGSKITTAVGFPLENLDMRPFCSDECRDQTTTYDLVGVVNHRGSMGGGHYVAYCKNYLTKQWYEFDDSRVTKVDSSAVLGTEGYVLFYQKNQSAIVPLRRELEPIIRSPKAAEEPKLYINKAWLEAFYTFANPGPIKNDFFLCPHGNNLYAIQDRINDVAVPIPARAYERLYAEFGGGPRVEELKNCEDCKQHYNKLAERRAREKVEITKLDSTSLRGGDEYWYIVDGEWLTRWHSWTNGDEPPGPISNQNLMQPRKEGEPWVVRAKLKKAKNYRGINANVWNFFIQEHGGGPTIVRRNIDIYEEPVQPDA